MNLKVYETRKRSLLKAVSFRILEIGLDTLILSIFVSLHLAVTLAVILELLCLGLHFVFERGWNRIDYGRYVIRK